MRSSVLLGLLLALVACGLFACGSDNTPANTDCTPGYPDCTCAAGNACLTGLSCQNAKCAATVVDGDSEADACIPGYAGCACAANNVCLLGFVCESAKCQAETVDGDADNETCTPGYEGCACALGTACLSGLLCESAKCIKPALDGDTDGESAENEGEAASCSCPDYSGNYCMAVFPNENRKASAKDIMIVVAPNSADPADCGERATFLANNTIQASHVFDRCNPDFPIDIDTGTTLDFDTATRHFTITEQDDRKAVKINDTTASDYDFATEYCPTEHCFNDTIDMDETDKDCGGTTCAACASGKACKKNMDCKSHACYQLVCVEPVCGDGKHTSNEICDDGNTEVGDGCDEQCYPQPGWNCERVDGAPDVCTCDVSFCTPSSEPCKKAACAKTIGCYFENVSDQQSLPDSVIGNCRAETCDGQGGIKDVVNLNDTPADANMCSTGTCDSDGTPIQVSIQLGTACTAANLTGYCDGQGNCVECNSDQDCGDISKPVCTDHVCKGPTCTDYRKNGLETGVDCGGNTTCPRCAVGLACLSGSDCASGFCNYASTCVQCLDDAPCSAGMRCENGSCVALATHCLNNMKDATETDVDCGGIDCRGCGFGKTCNTMADCAGWLCLNGMCRNFIP